MATKTVALDEEAYGMLRRSKRGDESFSEAVKRLARPRRRLAEFGGMWKEISQEDRRSLKLAYSGLRAQDAKRAEKLRALWR